MTRHSSTKQINLGLPSPEWHKRLKKAAGKQGVTAYILSILEPVLNGRVEIQFGKNGLVERFWKTGVQKKMLLSLPKKRGPKKRNGGALS